MMRKKMKGCRYLSGLVLCLCCALLMTGCGGGSASTGDSANGGVSYSVQEDGSKNASNYDGVSNDLMVNKSAQQNGDEAAGDSMENGEKETSSATEETSNTTEDSKKLNREMLVYRGAVSVDSLKFEKSVAGVKELLKKDEGFIESEQYSDDGDYSQYYDETADRHRTYTATVRIPSKKYDSFMEGMGDFGDVRRKESNVENVTKQYGTYQAQLEVYQAQYDRYMELLKKTKDEQTALKLQDKLFELQVTIAGIKSNMDNLQTDVAYSYMDITIREVRRYQDQTKPRDTFWRRLKLTCHDSWVSFLDFLEGLLFFLIRAWYYIVIALVILYFIRKRHRKNREKRQKQAKTAPTIDRRILPDGTVEEMIRRPGQGGAAGENEASSDPVQMPGTNEVLPGSGKTATELEEAPMPEKEAPESGKDAQQS